MDKDIKKDNIDLDDLFDEESIEEEPEEAPQLSDEEVLEYIPQDNLNLFLSEEEIGKLSDDEIVLYRQSIEMALEKYDDIFMADGEEIYTIEEVKQLKEIEKKLYKEEKNRRKGTEKKGFFEHIKVWMAVYGVIMILLNIFPVNPFLPGMLYNTLYEKMPAFLQTHSGFDAFMIVYYCLMGLPGFIIWLFLKKDTKEKKVSAWIFFVISCIIAVLVLGGVFVYIKWLR